MDTRRLAVEGLSDADFAALGLEEKLHHLNAVGAEILRVGNARQDAIHKLADARVAQALGRPGDAELKATVIREKAMYDALGMRLQTLKLFSSNFQTQINALKKF